MLLVRDLFLFIRLLQSLPRKIQDLSSQKQIGTAKLQSGLYHLHIPS
ncbi:unnamed protein product, partial [Linum tenue]